MSYDCVPTVLSSGDLIGLTITSEAGLLSACAILTLAYLIIRRLLLRVSSKTPANLVKTHLDVYMISLLASDTLQAIGAILDVRWVHEGHVRCGSYCTTQGIIQSLGEPSVAMATIAITLHTFCVIFFRWKPSRSFLVPVLVVCAIWLYVALYVGISYAAHHTPGSEFFVPTPDWCWVSDHFWAERVTLEYFWLWSAASLSLTLYIPLFLVIRGNLRFEVSDQGLWRLSFRRSNPRSSTVSTHSVQSLKMLLYPLSYIAVVLPILLIRFTSSRARSPFWTFFGISIYGLSGVTNVLLITLTRPSILSFGSDGPHVAPAETPPKAHAPRCIEIDGRHCDYDYDYSLADLDRDIRKLNAAAARTARSPGVRAANENPSKVSQSSVGLRTPDAAYRSQEKHGP